jgi:hypothetical protein
MNRDVIRQMMVISAMVATMIVNFLSTWLPINGQTAADISNRLPILFVPANYVFGIWGIIYTLLIGFTVYQALPAQRENALLRRIGYWFVASCVANIIWLLFFHYNQFALSMVAMVALLITLIMIYRTIRAAGSLTNAARIWVQGAFSVYLGWITVATVANASYVLYDANWDGFGMSPAVWAVVMLVIATVITGYIVLQYRDWAYAAVILWALAGIVVKQVDTQLVAITAGVMFAIIAASLAYVFVRRSQNSVAAIPA